MIAILGKRKIRGAPGSGRAQRHETDTETKSKYAVAEWETHWHGVWVPISLKTFLCVKNL
jgi:hypothetical protein